MKSFNGLNLSTKTIESLKKLGYSAPSKIQERVIPKILKGSNIVAQSETGSGKTHAFLIPIIDKLNTKQDLLKVIIFCPTRELATQTWKFAQEFSKFDNNLRVQLLTSGNDRERSMKKLNQNPQIIIGTPGRIKDAYNYKKIDVSHVSQIVMDEADMLLDMGYLEDVNETISTCKNPQIMVFSATLKDNLKYQLSKFIASNNEEIINDDAQTSTTVSHFAINIKHMDLTISTEMFLKAKNPYSIIVFCSKIDMVKTIYDYLRKKNYSVGALYGELSSRERKTMLRRFKSGEFQVLVSSDLGARGIDIEGVSEILNVDLPKEIEYYFHRAGRTGRFGKNGDCYTFYNSDSPKQIQTLMQNGINFTFLKFKDGTLIPDKGLVFEHRRTAKIDNELETKIMIARSQVRSKKVKPGYKRKMRLAEQKVKSKAKQERIHKQMRKIRVQKYIEESKNNE